MDAGRVLASRYTLDERLGRGGMGEVWRGTDQRMRRAVAIKIIVADLQSDPAVTARFIREATTAGSLQHNGITVVYDVGEHDGHPFFVMELLTGEDLATVLRRSPTGLPLDVVISVATQVSDALSTAHERGIVHRDIKPANLMMLAAGTVKICDFGISKLTEGTTNLTHGTLIGTPAYMAPEQFKGGTLDGRTDLYALGCTIHALLTGAPPFSTTQAPFALMYQHLDAPAPPLRALRPDTPADLETLVLQLLAKEPAERPATAAMVRDRLGALGLARSPTSEHTLPPGAPTVPPIRWETSPVPGNPLPGPTTGPPARLLRRRGFLLAGLGTAAGVAAITVPILVFGHDSIGGEATPESRGIVRPPSPPIIVPATLSGHTNTLYSVAFGPDGATLATAGVDDTTRLWDLTTGRTTRTLTGHIDDVNAVTFSPDGESIATGGDDKTVRLWDPTTGSNTRTLDGHTERVWFVAFSPDGKTLASGSADKTARLWDPTTGRATATLSGHTDVVRSVAFSPDGKTLATVSWDGTVRLWDSTTGRTIRTLTGHAGNVRAVAFSPDGETLATGGNDKIVRLWDPTTGRTTRTLEGHTDTISSVAFSPDGKTLATGSWDNTARLWDPTTGSGTATLDGHTKDISSLAISPDGNTLATASDDTTARLWKIP